MVVVVVMPHVIFFQPKPQPALHREMVGGVMQHVVEKITDEQPGKRRRRHLAKNKEEHSAKEKRERNADDRRHDQAAGVFRVIVMDAVQQKMELFSPAARRLIM